MNRRDVFGLLGVLSILTAVLFWVDPYSIFEKAGLFVTKYIFIIVDSAIGVYLLMIEKEVDAK